MKNLTVELSRIDTLFSDEGNAPAKYIVDARENTGSCGEVFCKSAQVLKMFAEAVNAYTNAVPVAGIDEAIKISNAEGYAVEITHWSVYNESGSDMLYKASLVEGKSGRGEIELTSLENLRQLAVVLMEYIATLA